MFAGNQINFNGGIGFIIGIIAELSAHNLFSVKKRNKIGIGGKFNRNSFIITFEFPLKAERGASENLNYT